MLTKLLIFLLLSISVYSQDIQLKDTINNATTQYKQALKLFKEKKYQKSYDLFNILFRDNLDDAKINFYLGRSAFELKKYSEAIIAYERVLFQEPNSFRVKLELGRTFFLYKAYGEATRLFNEVKNIQNVPPKITKTANKYLDLLSLKHNKNNSKHSLHGILMLGINNDSNIKNTAEPHTLGSFAYSGTKETASSHQEIAVFNYKYNITNSLSTKQSFLLLHKTMFDDKYESNNIKLYKWTPSLTKIYSTKLMVDYAVFMDILYENSISMLKTYGLYPSISYNYDDKNMITGNFKYQKKEYQQLIDILKNSSVLELSSTLTNLYSKKFINSYTFAYAKEKRSIGTRTDISNTNFTLAFKNKYIYKPHISFSTSLSYKQTKFDELNQTFLFYKKDKLYNLGFSNTYVFDPKFIVQANINFIKQTSNIKADVYNKNTFALNLIRPF